MVLVASPSTAFELDRFFIPKELVLHLTAAVAGLLAIGAIRRAGRSWIDLVLAGYLLLTAASAMMATNGWLALQALAVSGSSLVIFWVGRGLRMAGLERALLGGIVLAVIVAAGTSLLQAYGVRIDLFSANRAPGGTLGNRNFVAHLAAFGLPLLLLLALWVRRKGSYLLSLIGVAIVTASLVLTRSRASWLATAAVVFIFSIAMMLSGPLRRHGRSWARLAGVLIVAAAAVAAALLIPNTLRWRSDNPYLDSVTGVVNYEEGSGRGRLVQYERSLRMATRHPLLGVGPGNWAVLYPEYAGDGDPSMDPSESGRTFNPWPSSDWVAFAAERGFPAAALLALIFVGVAAAGFRGLFRAGDAEEGARAAALLASVAATLITGMFDAVLLLAVPTLLVWASLGVLWPLRPPMVSRPLRVLFVLPVVALTMVGAARSGAQLAAMEIYATTGDRASLRRAARIDPGNYRIHLRLARGGKRAQRCDHARAAHALFPNAETARHLSRGCED